MLQAPKDLRSFAALIQVVEHLRGPEGCPWDKEQTHKSLARFALEEAAELAEVLETGDSQGICEELGDVLLQVVLNAVIAKQEGRFTVDDVIEGISTKMVRRHPHVFGDVTVKDSAEVLRNWQELKASEKKAASKGPIADGFNLPKTISPLLAAHKIGEITHKQNFDWPDVRSVMKKLHEEVAELDEALESRDEALDEAGDVLFSAAQVIRHLGGDAEQVLRKANRKFERRYMVMLEEIEETGGSTTSMSQEELETAWARAKLAVSRQGAEK